MPLKLLPGLLIPKRHRHETPNSYIHRLEQGLLLDPGTLRRVARSTAPTKTKGDVRAEHHRLVEQLTGLAPGPLSAVGEQDLYSSDTTRLECIDCADGQHIELVPHIESFSCMEHRRWTGIQASSDDGRTHYKPPTPDTGAIGFIDEEVENAESTYRDLRCEGRSTSTLLRECLELLAGPSDGLAPQVPGPSDYVALVGILELLTSTGIHLRLFNPELTFAEARHVLDDLLTVHVPQAKRDAADRIWLYLRPLFFAVRRHLQGEAPGFALYLRIDLDAIVERSRVGQPLEPFRRYLDQLATPMPTAADRWRQDYLVASAESPRAETRMTDVQTVLCREGHLTHRGAYKIRDSLLQGRPPCSVCTGHQALAGASSLEQTHPLLAQQWDLDNNDGRAPSTVVAGSNKSSSWRCPQGHGYRATVANRALNGANCPVCAGMKVLTGVNDLATTHPDLAREWHPTLNDPIAPDQVIAASGTKISWQCEEGHVYEKTIAKRKRGQGCPVCTGRKVMVGINDLGTTHPQLASEWHPQANGTVRPEHLSAGSEKIVNWQCVAGHSYHAPVVNRASSRKAGCPYCSSRKFLQGFNDLQSQYPALARDWDTARNEGLTAVEVRPGNRKRWWTCKSGHSQHMLFRNRLRARGCTQCQPGVRAGFDSSLVGREKK